MITKIKNSKAEIINPMSSNIPREKDAEKPITDHISGISSSTTGSFLPDHNKIPKVKMVVGQGSPNVGEEG